MVCWRTNVALPFFVALFLGLHAVDYGDLEAMGLACPDRNSCAGYRNDKGVLERSCECDPDCATYGDCCMDAEEKSSARGPSGGVFECLQYGYDRFTGVYAVSRCHATWTGPTEIKQKCEGTTDFSDPISAAPVTSLTRRITYKNMHCAECNHAEKEPLKSFSYEYACGVSAASKLPTKDIMEHLQYNPEKNKWGVKVWGNKEEQPTFEECAVIFDVPAALNWSVRFCRANVVSDCSSDWIDPLVRQLCLEYTSVVFDRQRGYRNPHCAICNHGVTSQLSCSVNRVDARDKLVPFTTLKKNPSSFRQMFMVNKPHHRCPEGRVFDRFSNKCRKVTCALPGYVIRNHKCVKSD